MGKARSEPAPFDDVVLICAKCAAKLGRGRKGKTELKGEVKDALKRHGLGKSVRVAETTCLDLCPKNGQTIALGGGLAEGRLWVVDADADGDTVAKLVLESRSPLRRKPARAHIPPPAKRRREATQSEDSEWPR